MIYQAAIEYEIPGIQPQTTKYRIGGIQLQPFRITTEMYDKINPKTPSGADLGGLEIISMAPPDNDGTGSRDVRKGNGNGTRQGGNSSGCGKDENSN